MPEPFYYHDALMTEVMYRKLYQATFTLKPENWKNYEPLVELDWKVVRFCDESTDLIPDDFGGVYSFTICPDVAAHPRCSNLIYIGETSRPFKDRYKEYLYDRENPKARVFVKLMFGLWYEHLWYCYAKIEDKSLIHTVQDNLIRALDPVINRQYPEDVRGQYIGAAL